jgi:exosortase
VDNVCINNFKSGRQPTTPNLSLATDTDKAGQSKIPLTPENPINSINSTSSNNSFRTSFFAALCAAGGVVFGESLRDLALLSLEDTLYSHIGLIPLFSFAIIFLRRREIFSRVEFAPVIGGAVFLTGLMLLLVGKSLQPGLGKNDYLSIYTSGFMLWTIGAFVGIYGARTFRRAMFPLLFLLFIVPVPAVVLDRSIIFLQQMTTETVDGIFGLVGLPYFRTETVFQLPEVTIQVAEQCSGIRSSLALIVATTAAGYVFLETGWRRLLLVLTIIPITILKNALRVTTLTLMASYVDPAWLTDSWLHRAGGKPFFFIALLLWAPILWMLWRSERKYHPRCKTEGEGRTVNKAQSSVLTAER